MTPEIAWRQKYEDEFHRNAAYLLTEQRLRKELEQANAIIARLAKGMTLNLLGRDTFANGTRYSEGTVVIQRGLQVVCLADEWLELAAWLERRNEVQNP